MEYLSQHKVVTSLEIVPNVGARWEVRAFRRPGRKGRSRRASGTGRESPRDRLAAIATRSWELVPPVTAASCRMRPAPQSWRSKHFAAAPGSGGRRPEVRVSLQSSNGILPLGLDVEGRRAEHSDLPPVQPGCCPIRTPGTQSLPQEFRVWCRATAGLGP